MTSNELSRKKQETITWLDAIPSRIRSITPNAIGKDHFNIVTIDFSMPDGVVEVTLLLRDTAVEELKPIIARDIGLRDGRPAYVLLENGRDVPVQQLD